MTEQERRAHDEELEKAKREHVLKLVHRAIDKFESEKDEEGKLNKKVVRNSNPSNYELFANRLNKISKELPKLDPEQFGWAAGKTDGPSNELAVTTTQISNAAMGKTFNLRDHFNETLHWYLHGKPSRRAAEFEVPATDHRKKYRTLRAICVALAAAIVVFVVSLIVLSNRYFDVRKELHSTSNRFDAIKQDMRILPYQPTQAEIAQLEGVYMVYTASPQARKSDPDRYHKVVPNILTVNYKDGYFTFDRIGHDFEQKGYMQFEDSNLVSMHSYMISSLGKRSPKKSLLPLENGKDTFTVISTSWSFDPNPEDNISLGIREVFIKIGKPGSITQIVNSQRNFGKAGKLFDLKKQDGSIETIHIQNERLESLPQSLQALLNEKSILLKDPDPKVILEKPFRN